MKTFWMIPISACVAIAIEATVANAQQLPHLAKCPAPPASSLPSPWPKPFKFDPATGDTTIDESLASVAIPIVVLFETGKKKEAWGTVSAIDTLSVGAMQWNWSAQTLFTQLFKETAYEDIADAKPVLQPDLRILKAYSEAINDASVPQAEKALRRKAALTVIQNWKIGDKIQKKIREQLSEWLSSQRMRAVQIRTRQVYYVAPAFSYARRWRQDTGSQKPIDARLVTYFLDLRTFNGDPHRFWVDHVRTLRSSYGTRKNAVGSVASWLDSCKKSPQLTGIPDAVNSASHWRTKADALDDEEVDLLLLGLLVARTSTGSGGTGVYGYFQADVLTRRGIVIAGGHRGKFFPDFQSLANYVK